MLLDDEALFPMVFVAAATDVVRLDCRDWAAWCVFQRFLYEEF
jgi:hypothetical protein